MEPDLASAISPTGPVVAVGHEKPTESCLVGVEPIDRIVMMENHDQAYHAWKNAGLRDRIVVHVDPHIDFGWLPERDPAELLDLQSLGEIEEQVAGPLWNLSGRSTQQLIQIGNYLNPALREGIVRSFYWVVPDGFFETARRRRLLEEELRSLKKAHPRAFGNVTWAGGSLRGEIYGTEMTVCTLSGLPAFDESVLLDIDTDFLVIGSISASYPYADPPNATPWMWPDELVAKLRQRQLRTDFVTIAYSVEGGFTPLAYKNLGDEVAMLLRNPASTGNQRGMALKRQAASFQREKRFEEAISLYEGAMATSAGDASTHYQLAQLVYEQGHREQARGHYQRAVALDPSYRTAFNTLGPVYLALDLHAQSEAEFRRALAFDPDDADAYYGLADLRLDQRKWNEAIAYYQRASELGPDDGRARLGVGYAHLKMRSWQAAAAELRQALSSERYQGAAQYRLGYVYCKTRRWDDALAAYKAARRLGFRDLRTHSSLGRLYLRKGNFHKARRHYRKVIRLLPALALSYARRLRERIMQIVPKTRHEGGQPA